MNLKALLIIKFVTKIELLSNVTLLDIRLTEVLEVLMNNECLLSIISMHTTENYVPPFIISSIFTT